jgi:hypothetical protein
MTQKRLAPNGVYHVDISGEMVLQGRIELPTSPLPRECSTTELLQRPYGAGELAAKNSIRNPSLDGFFICGYQKGHE